MQSRKGGDDLVRGRELLDGRNRNIVRNPKKKKKKRKKKVSGTCCCRKSSTTLRKRGEKKRSDSLPFSSRCPTSFRRGDCCLSNRKGKKHPFKNCQPGEGEGLRFRGRSFLTWKRSRVIGRKSTFRGIPEEETPTKKKKNLIP